MDGDRSFNPDHQSISVVRGLSVGSLRAQPFLHLCSAPCLGRDHHEALVATLPPRGSLVADIARWSNLGIRIPSSRVLATQTFPQWWQQFVEHHTSQAFWNELVQVFGADIRSSYPDLERELDRPLDDWRVVRRGDEMGAEITLECEIVVTPFEMQRPSPRDVPRTATANRLWTGLLHLCADGDEATVETVFRNDAAECSGKIRSTRTDRLCELSWPQDSNMFVGFVEPPDAVRRIGEPLCHGRSLCYVEFSAQVNHPVYGLLSRGAAQQEWFRFFQRQGYR